MATLIRKAETTDVPHIAPLLGQLGYPARPGEVEPRVAAWTKDPYSVLVVAEVDGAPAGVAAMHAFPLLEHSVRRGRLVALVVDDSVRGQSVGRALLEASEPSARDLGCRDMEVTSSRTRTAAPEFYARLGYDDACGRAAPLS
jgi:N-acetylglutamate synthase-like GNAT family acetyltransferase